MKFSPLILLMLTAATFAQPPALTVTDVGEAYDANHVEFRGVAAGEFEPRHWESRPPSFVPDIRSPLLEPRDSGRFRNIYAPSVIKSGDAWHVYYGGWDGEKSGNDRIYRVDVDPHFLAFTNRRTVIEHGDFHHVCNVNVVPAARGRGLAMACTAYPAAEGLNKSVTFFSDDGEKWNAAAARRHDLITMSGYEKFAAADINGMNVLLTEDGKYRLYFSNFRDSGKTFRASSDDGRQFQFDGVVHEPSAIVNDVKRFDLAGGEKRYLMALHRNGPSLYFAMSRDGTRFSAMKTLASYGGEADRHIVAIGWVVEDGRLLGFLYGAGAASSLDRNRIFARWLQRKVIINDHGKPAGDAKSLGPDRQLIPLAAAVTATVGLHDEAGEFIAASNPVELKPGRAYRVERPAARQPRTQSTPSAAGREATPR
jgi:hypothetical protein